MFVRNKNCSNSRQFLKLNARFDIPFGKTSNIVAEYWICNNIEFI